ncbi:MAG: sigma-70 family RNA polymerase sigma factor [Planctomycetaceae bacterium]
MAFAVPLCPGVGIFSGMEIDDESKLPAGRAGSFATTHWSLVIAAGNDAGEESRRALEELCRAYWSPLYAYVRRRVSSVHEAQDLTQAFFERLLEKQYLAVADPNRGRFRSFLISAFKHFLSKEWDKAKAQKRGGERAIFSMDFQALDIVWGATADSQTPDYVFDRQWAITLLGRVMLKLQRDMERLGKSREFRFLKDFVGNSGSVSYREVASELGMSESAARMTASRMRGRYRELLHAEIAQTVGSAEEVEEEIRYLFKVLSS